MTILDDRPLDESAPDTDDDTAFSVPEPAEAAGGGTENAGPAEAKAGAAAEERVVKPGMIAVAAALTCLGGVWMTTRVFRGSVVPPSVGALGVLIGVGLVYLSYRASAVMQYLVLPVALVAGALLATTGEVKGQSLPAAVMDAFRGGGLLEPPIPFDPGWRFLLVVLFAFVGAAATAIAVSSARPKLAVAIPAPLVLGAALLQPEGSELVVSGIAMLFVVAGMAVAFGADLASEGVGGAGFEMRRLGRGVTLMAGALVLLVVVAQSDFLFPATEKNQVIPPQKPPPPAPEADRELFTVKSPKSVPWRLGVLDVYDDNGFLLPSIDPKRMKAVPRSGVVADPGPRTTFEATFTIKDVKGQVLPGLPEAVALKGVKKKATYDPRVQTFKLVETSIPQGMTYTVVAPEPADFKLLGAAPPAPAELAEFAEMPPAPPGVQKLLADAPVDNRFERLQFVRIALYSNVVAAGAGRPGDVPPAKVDEMLAGGNASPYEITAAEVMLARWAGIPARIGFGFYGGDKKGEELSFRPRHGAAWLEAYFHGSGWVPILGTPPKAKASLSEEDKKQEPNVVASEELGLRVFVPVRLTTARLIYEIVRYYVFTFGPLVLLGALLLWLYPVALKGLRSMKRRRWALAAGGPARVAVAYAELRDALHDLNIGRPSLTPLQFVQIAEHDDEHEELAWLVTRALWADLRRDLRMDDVEAAEEMARSVSRRIVSAQTPLNRVLGLASRASLREPWSSEVPNLWRARRRRLGVRSLLRSLRRRLPWRRLRAAVATSLVAVLLGSCAGTGGRSADAPAAYFEPLMPAQVGSYEVNREDKIEGEFKRPGDRGLVSEGRVFTIRTGDTVEGAVQVALFKDDVDNQDPKVQAGVQKGLGAATGFRVQHFGIVRLYKQMTAEQQIFLWFPPERNVMELFVMRRQFGDAERVVQAVIRHQRRMAAPQGALV